MIGDDGRMVGRLLLAPVTPESFAYGRPDGEARALPLLRRNTSNMVSRRCIDSLLWAY